MNPISKMYNWYDDQKEPYRFIMFFVPLVFLIAGSHGSNVAFSITCVSFLLFIMITRLVHVFGKPIMEFVSKIKKQKKVKKID